ncbi:retrotransposon protein, putative, ty1-copia subclass [Tanacetum coccineum]
MRQLMSSENGVNPPAPNPSHNSSFSLLSVLGRERLTGPNYMDWIRNLRFILRYENKEYVLDEQIPTINDNSTQEKIEAHQKHYDDANKVSCIMAKASKERLDVVKSLMACKPKPGTSICALIESVDEEPIVNTDSQQEVVTPVEPNDVSLPIRRTSRVSKPPQDPQFYYGFHIEEDKISDSTLSELDEPANYKEAMASPEAAKWKEAMKSEIQSMYDNQVWNLVDTTTGLKTVGCKWIFKKKTDMDGKMDVKTAFLNGKLTEHVFMAQPEGFENAKYPK